MAIERRKAHQLLVELGLAKDRAHAEALIMSGKVVGYVGERDWRVEKPGDLLPAGTALRLKDASQFVSRGGDKLMSAVNALRLENSFAGKLVVDVGSSTGGFTDCVLHLGAAHVTAIDVGHNQLDWRLRGDARVTSVESTHVCDFSKNSDSAFDWVLADLSFVGLENVLDCLIKLALPEGQLLLLVKPQFELPVSEVPSGGVVLDDLARKKAIASVCNAMANRGMTVVRTVDSGVSGRTGNQETFVLAKRS